MKRLVIFLIISLMAIPLPLIAKDKKTGHIKTAEYQECSECHTSEKELWDTGKHGLMNVKCVVCHGSTYKNFTAKPDIYKCSGCHSEKVADVEKKLLPKQKTCFLCHDAHSVAAKFHTKGGN